MGRELGGRRDIVEECRVLDLSYLKREGFLKPGRSFSVNYSHLGLKVLVRVFEDHLILKHHNLRDVGSWKLSEQNIHLEWSPCHFGGSRPWFRCGGTPNGGPCGKRVTKLYGQGQLFACRHCLDLGYESQGEHSGQRALRLVGKIKELTDIFGDGGIRRCFDCSGLAVRCRL